jgi:hypothetical protein
MAVLRASDPWLSFAPNGDLHHISLSFSPGQTNAMLVNRSTDGGLTWTDPVRLILDSGRFFNDKETITADPTNRHFVYAVWDRLDFFANRGPAVYSRSVTGGRSWTPVRVLYDPGPGGQTIGNQIVVLPNGTVLNFFNEIFLGDRVLALKRSFDKGAVWKPKLGRVFVSRMQQRSAAVPGSHALVRDGAILFDVAVDRRRGTLYAVWQDSSFSSAGHPAIAFTMSRNNGNTWSKPVKVNRTPKSPSRSFREQAFTASVHVAANGLVGVSYYDFRNDTDDPSGLTDSWLVWCHPFASNCGRSARWKDEARLTDDSFDITEAPFAGGLFLGDYVGLSAAGNDFVALFTQPHDDDRSSAFMRRVVVEQRIEPRSAGFWKHQLRVVLTGRGRGHLDETELTAALQDIKVLYNVLDQVKRLDDLLALLMPEGAFDLRGQTVRQLDRAAAPVLRCRPRLVGRREHRCDHRRPRRSDGLLRRAGGGEEPRRSDQPGRVPGRSVDRRPTAERGRRPDSPAGGDAGCRRRWGTAGHRSTAGRNRLTRAAKRILQNTRRFRRHRPGRSD